MGHEVRSKKAGERCGAHTLIARHLTHLAGGSLPGGRVMAGRNVRGNFCKQDSDVPKSSPISRSDRYVCHNVYRKPKADEEI